MVTNMVVDDSAIAENEVLEDEQVAGVITELATATEDDELKE